MTVDKAINRGQLFVNGPVFIIMMGLMGWLMYAAVAEILPIYFLPGGLIIGPSVAWIYWSFAITKWRIWAYKNVDDIYDLKFNAVLAGLIWSDGSFFEKTEIRTLREKNLINALENKYRKYKRKYADDINVQDSTLYNYSKLSLIINIIIMFSSIIIGAYQIIIDKVIIGLLFIIFGMYNIIKNYRRLTNSTSLIISNIGVEVEGEKYNWSEISNERLTLEGLGRNQSHYFKFNTSTDEISVDLTDFDIKLADFRHGIKVYRWRANNQ